MTNSNNNNNTNGRPKVTLYHFDENGKHTTHDNKTIHRLVAETFIPNPYNLPVVMHIDNDILHNHVSNLKWGTAKENVRQCIDEGRRNIPYYKSVYEISNDNESISCIGKDELCKAIEYGRVPPMGTTLTKGRYKGYTIKKTDKKVINPFRFV